MNYYGLHREGDCVSLMVSGCRHDMCPASGISSFSYGASVTDSVVSEIIGMLSEPGVAKFYINGGDAFEPENIQGMIDVLHSVKRVKSKPKVVVWSCHSFESMLIVHESRCLLKLIDILASFGSGKPVIVDVKKSLATFETVKLPSIEL